MDPVPMHRKFGYDHMIEMRQIEDMLRADGIEGVALHFAIVTEYETRHRNDLPLRESQKPWLATQIANSKPDLLRLALEEIAAGHNDPRALARMVLER